MTSQPWIPAKKALSLTKETGFNGAMTSQPWIPAKKALSLTKETGFNGAMTSQPWILGSLIKIVSKRMELQWSHDLSAMDTTSKQLTLSWVVVASMEP